jgi:hypothetical protein
MATFKKYVPKNEPELHSIIKKDLDSLEEGLTLLQHEIDVKSGIPDFLCVDKGGRLTIIEVKLEEDEYILYQGLRYYSEIYKNRFQIAQRFPKANIDPDVKPRIILVAKNYSEIVRTIATFINPDIELFEYHVREDSNGIKGMVYNLISLPKSEITLEEPTTLEDHRDYLKKEELKPFFEKIRTEIKNLNKEIDENFTTGYIGYKYNGRLIAWITTKRYSFDFNVYVIDGLHPEMSIKSSPIDFILL